MTLDLFAGIPVNDYERATAWYSQLFGAEPSSRPNDIEAVWGLVDHGHAYIVVRPERAGFATITCFVSDFDDRIGDIKSRGLDPDAREILENGVRKAIFLDPDGNEFTFAGAAQA